MINLIQGADKTISVQLTKSPSGYVDLTSASEISVKIPSLGAAIEKLKSTGGVTVTGAATGEFEFSLSDTETATLRVGENQSWEITVDIGSNRKIYQVTENMNVKAKLF